ncbi:MAG: hypothetical protein Q4G26_14410 [Paracoccus sp. (in: a-proteobacteria)]|nr:hypothetical protein [Paracoccus sp. (in: a-proteobacteria)]
MLKTLALRAVLLPLALGFACLLAGVYGALHNQISYSVAPSYFTEFKFFQFRMPPALHDRLGATLIGWRASWWMGLFIGLPLWLLCLLVQGTGAAIRAYLLAGLAVVMVTLAMGIGALIWGVLVFGPDNLPLWVFGRNLSDPVSFAIGGNMHNLTYLGGVIGLIAGAVVVIWQARAVRKGARTGG